MPRRSGSPKGSGEVLERDRGSKSPVSFQPPPRGANKIYRSDAVFLMEESKTNDISQPQLPFTPPRGANKIYTYDVVFPIGEARKKVPKPTAASIHSPRKNAIAPRRKLDAEFSKLNSRQPLANDLRRERTEPHWEAIGLAQTISISIPI